MGRTDQPEETVTTTHDQNVDAARRERIRVPAELPKGPLGKAIGWWSRRAYGDVTEPAWCWTTTAGFTAELSRA